MLLYCIERTVHFVSIYFLILYIVFLLKIKYSLQNITKFATNHNQYVTAGPFELKVAVIIYSAVTDSLHKMYGRNLQVYTADIGFNDIGLYDTSSIAPDILWCRLIRHC